MKVVIILFIILVLLVGIGVVRLLMLRSQVAHYREYWQNQATIKPPDNALVYVALGDSAAQGIGASSPRKGYVGLLADSLAEKYKRPVHVINLSVTGARVQDVIDTQLPRLKTLRLPADAVISLDIGSNNMRTYDQAAFASQIDELFAALPKQTVVAEIPYFGGGRANKYERMALEATDSIHDSAKKYGLRVAPLHRTTKEGDGFSTYAADFFHPSDRGYQNWYQAFWEVLSKD